MLALQMLVVAVEVTCSQPNIMLPKKAVNEKNSHLCHVR